MKVLYDPNFGGAALGVTGVECPPNHCTCNGTYDPCTALCAALACQGEQCVELSCGGQQCGANSCAANVARGPVLI